jgi:hypothetical protein
VLASEKPISFRLIGSGVLEASRHSKCLKSLELLVLANDAHEIPRGKTIVRRRIGIERAIP